MEDSDVLGKDEPTECSKDPLGEMKTVDCLAQSNMVYVGQSNGFGAGT